METMEQAEDRKRLRKYVETEGLTSVLNNTKWQQLFTRLEGIQGILDFRRRDVRDAPDFAPRWDGDIYHMFGGWDNIEWLDIRAQVTQQRGALVAPKVEDHTDALIDAVRSSGVPFTITSDGVRVWGYIRPGASPQWS
jgi:Family of unknown function (DUF6678)